MKVITIVGARPQFVKAAPVCRELAKAEVEEVMVHTGQHYDHLMSQVFFNNLKISTPRYELRVGSGTHGVQTGNMLAKIESVLVKEQPDWVLVYGDTNSTLAGALAAAKLHIPIAHIEAGLRSFNRRMPEEINRVLTDHVSQLLFAPTAVAIENLRCEGIVRGAHLVGDVMYDAAIEHSAIARDTSKALATLGLVPKTYLLATIHRAENTDSADRLHNLIDSLRQLSRDEKVILPVHPRTRPYIGRLELQGAPNLVVLEPLSYLDMLKVMVNARVVLTDSGGVQKEAQWLEVPCVTLRDETEWVETVSCGWNQLVGTDPDKILCAARNARHPGVPPCYVTPGAARAIVGILTDTATVSTFGNEERVHECLDRKSIRDHAVASRSHAPL